MSDIELSNCKLCGSKPVHEYNDYIGDGMVFCSNKDCALLTDICLSPDNWHILMDDSGFKQPLKLSGSTILKE